MKRLARLVLFAALSPAAYSQSVLYTFEGNSVGDFFGTSVSGAGDVNNDGFEDLIVGAPGDKLQNRGSARVFSGADGSIIYTFVGDSPNDSLGRSVSGAGDVNGDGYADLIVGAEWDDNNGWNSGSARVFSGIDGSVLYTFYGDSSGGDLGWSVSGAGDVNGDGTDDVIVGAPGDWANGLGSARVFSGLDGSVLYTFNGDSEYDGLGISVSGAGDVNGDGYADLIVGAMWDDNNGDASGSARVFSGVDGSILYTFDGDSAFDMLGYSVSGGGDVNGDGFDDLIVGAPLGWGSGDGPGTARVFSGLDGRVLYAFEGDSQGDMFGASVSGAGDIDGDGYADLIVGAPYDFLVSPDSPGYARVFSGVDGSVMYTVDIDSPGDLFGGSVSGAGDIDGDGYDDIIVGALGDDNNGYAAGSAHVFSGRRVVGVNYCTATTNSTGSPASITAFDSRVVAENKTTLETRNVAPQQFGYYLMSDAQAFVPGFGGSQGNLCLGPPILRLAKDVGFSGPAGVITLTLDLTSLPQGTVFQPGETWNFQLWFRDDLAGFTSNTSDGLAVQFK